MRVPGRENRASGIFLSAALVSCVIRIWSVCCYAETASHQNLVDADVGVLLWCASFGRRSSEERNVDVFQSTGAVSGVRAAVVTDRVSYVCVCVCVCVSVCVSVCMCVRWLCFDP